MGITYTLELWLFSEILKTFCYILSSFSLEIVKNFSNMNLNVMISYCRETTLGGSMNSVSDLIRYVGWLSTIAMRLENNSTFLLHFILDFYEKVVHIPFSLFRFCDGYPLYCSIL